jgi:hypothetical protein
MAGSADSNVVSALRRASRRCVAFRGLDTGSSVRVVNSGSHETRGLCGYRGPTASCEP